MNTPCMGGILSRWKGKQGGYEEKKKELEEVDQQIRDELSAKKNVEQVRRARLTLLLLLFIVGLILAILHVVVRYLSGKPVKAILVDWTLMAPFVVLPLVLYLLRVVLQFYYGWRTASVNVRLGKLQKQKADTVEALKKAIDFDHVRMYELVQRHAAPPDAPAPHTQKPQPQPQVQPQAPPSRGPRSPAPVSPARGQPTRPPAAAAAPPTPARKPAPPVAPEPAPAHADPVQPLTDIVSQPQPRPVQSQPQPQPQPDLPAELRQRSTPVRNPTAIGLPKHYQPVNRTQAAPPVVGPTEPPPNRGWFGALIDNFLGDVPQNTAPVLCQKCRRPNPPPPSFYELAAYEFSCVYCGERNNVAKLEQSKDYKPSSDTVVAKSPESSKAD